MTQLRATITESNVHVQPLTLEAFAPFGSFVHHPNPKTPQLGAPPIEFFRDMLPLQLGHGVPMFSTCRVAPRALLIDVLEYHSSTSEGILPLDADVLVQLAPASHPDDPPPLEHLRVFYVPHGTLLAIRAGVWHHAPFCVNRPANVLIVLPERTYANDCVVLKLEREFQRRITLSQPPESPSE